jgi:hypothetical protein
VTADLIAQAVVAVITIAYLAMLWAVLRHHEAERRGWAAERRALVDRAIAQHTGEILALDRLAQGPRPEREPAPAIEGLS